MLPRVPNSNLSQRNHGGKSGLPLATVEALIAMAERLLTNRNQDIYQMSNGWHVHYVIKSLPLGLHPRGRRLYNP